ncbi:SDR family NAD(P)-dependent oxidoreductase [Sphingomonas bacterium]|uniref:SDR family NAD(P)-dependent oxidoreductase n=1 Tax=Sphingomonas bacterium TaxID=1895847 RepID=UPI0015754B68|nr:SDR family NAD(P)-dependent oxidoreductase [Sphingomonas bacterium]
MTLRAKANSGQIIAVSGASTGIGAATARALAERGFHVLAGVRREEDAAAIRAANIEPIMLDIKDGHAVAALAQRIAADPERRPLRALVNNAGLQINAPVETLPLAVWRRLFDVNLFGHVAMVQALLPALIEGRGTIVNISSIGGKMAMAGYGPYAATKFALEAMSDSLRREVAPLGVKVVVVEPGAVATAMLGRVGDTGERVFSDMTAAQLGRYGKLMRAVVAQAQAAAGGAVPAEEVGRMIADAITSGRPRARYTVGRQAAVAAGLTKLLPDRVLDAMLARALKPYVSEDTTPE